MSHLPSPVSPSIFLAIAPQFPLFVTLPLCPAAYLLETFTVITMA